MKKIIVLLLILSLLLCVNATVSAAEGDDGSNEPAATVEDVSEDIVESTGEDETDATEEPATPEATDQAGEPETSETTAPAEESVVPEDDVPTGDPEVSQEPMDIEADGDMQPASSGEPVMNEEVPDDSPVATNAAFSVTIAWQGMSFTYHEKPKGQWDPSTLTYGEDGQHSWTSSDSENPTCGTITVTVNSEITDLDLVTASFRFVKEETFTPRVLMRFSNKKETVSSGSTTGSLEFNVDTANEQSMYVVPASGTLTSTDFENAGGKLGNITVTITAEELHDPPSPEGPEIG